ncbi:alpha-L-rhamnosidase [Salegentibacter agarivorans]|uniref:alpha-L-rhamnosidase n=1 Tax=Salegentibacter agarivorans TaxID=345907 RepID=A0A1I2MF12_9FLAO|nr:alpha-L-rhamnosidase [Salegentibacter agarivorans]SFF89568.1 alpha-L-rhamnosidase [Salegentibacter agarivorans]
MKKLIYTVSFMFIVQILFAQNIQVEETLLENRRNPLGIDIVHPQFTWKLSSDKRNVKQSAYQIQVAGTKNSLENEEGLLWDSGKVNSPQSVHIPYSGETVTSFNKYFWRVKVWDQNGKSSNWSKIGYWQMGLLNKNDWDAKWISASYSENSGKRPSPIFRKEFDIEKDIQSATAIITSRGLYEAYINGERVGDEYFTPGWTNYDERIQYQMYDVSKMVKNGENAVGAILGSGWYRGALAWEDNNNLYGDNISLLMQINVIYTDGSTDLITTDSSWKSSKSHIQSSEIYDGEMADASKIEKGWKRPGFNDSEWYNVRVESFGYDNLIATLNEPVKKQETFEPKEIIKTPKNEIVLDFGQNLVGFVKVKVNGKKGDTIKLYHAEVLDKDGNFYTANLRGADQKNTYILNGEGEEIFFPHFTWQGFRYVKVEAANEYIKPENFTAVALYSDMDETGSFYTSNESLNQLQRNIKWGQKGNFLDVPTDCPQRDERLGWTGDAQVFSRTAGFNMHVNNFFEKWLKDLASEQLENGSIPHVIPNVLGDDATGSAGWADAGTIIPWDLYTMYGNKRVLEEQYKSMEGWVQYMENESENNLWNTGFHFGDWLFYRPEDDNDGRAALTDKYLIAQCFFAHSTQNLINTAEVLGKEEDVKKYSELLKKIKKAFAKEYLTPNGRLVSSSQTAYVLALNFNMLPENLRSQAAKRLADNIVNYGYHLTTGFLGTPYLNHVLTRFGHHDLAYTLLMQKTYPSWLYPVTVGATTIWERWDGRKPDGSFQTPSMNSFNHYAYGAIGDWMYKTLSGINSATDPEGVGYKKIIFKPHTNNNLVSEKVEAQYENEGLTMVNGELETYYGKIKSFWKKDEGKIKMQFEIPVNTTSKIHLPTKEISSIKEGNRSLSSLNDVIINKDETGNVIVETGSGIYNFTIEN